MVETGVFGLCKANVFITVSVYFFNSDDACRKYCWKKNPFDVKLLHSFLELSDI